MYNAKTLPILNSIYIPPIISATIVPWFIFKYFISSIIHVYNFAWTYQLSASIEKMLVLKEIWFKMIEFILKNNNGKNKYLRICGIY